MTSFNLGDTAARQLVNHVKRLDSEISALQRYRRDQTNPIQQATYHIGKADGTITAMSGDTLGKGHVNVYRPDDTDIGTLIARFPVYNQAEEVPDGRVVGIQLGAFGYWYVTVEHCPP